MLPLELVNRLWEENEASGGTRCPHVSKDDRGCVCHSPCCGGLNREVAGHVSLQLWCLTTNYLNCIFHPSYGGISNEDQEAGAQG
jgi:hypothetical protein